MGLRRLDTDCTLKNWFRYSTWGICPHNLGIIGDDPPYSIHEILRNPKILDISFSQIMASTIFDFLRR